VRWYQKGKTNLDFTEARDSEWQWHQLGHMQVCTSIQTDNHASTQPLSFFTGRVPFLLPNQQHQSTEGRLQKIPALGRNHLYVVCFVRDAGNYYAMATESREEGQFTWCALGWNKQL